MARNLRAWHSPDTYEKEEDWKTKIIFPTAVCRNVTAGRVDMRSSMFSSGDATHTVVPTPRFHAPTPHVPGVHWHTFPITPRTVLYVVLRHSLSTVVFVWFVAKPASMSPTVGYRRYSAWQTRTLMMFPTFSCSWHIHYNDKNKITFIYIFFSLEFWNILKPEKQFRSSTSQ